MSILDQIQKPSDIRSFDYSRIAELGDEIRTCMINNVAHTGGHLASNLGVVELTMAIHRVFDSPKDQILFDVGHQCYVHKLLTGRYKEFKSLRQMDGLSGFPSPKESVHDPLKTGHSSTSISSAVGLLRAFQLKNENDRYVISVVGDGAMTGGLSYEGLNNGGKMRGNLIVILNDNDMSISKNVGSLADYLAKIRSRQGYFNFKDVLTRITRGTPLVGKAFYAFFQKIKRALKSVFYQGNIFENMGFVYFGPIDGHNQRTLERVLNRAKELKRPCLIHVKTVKGKGYTFAEEQPSNFHGLGSFNVETGKQSSDKKVDFSSVFGEELCALAENDSRICAITAAMASGCGLTDFSRRFPERFFDVGIAEQHALTFAGGLARNGMKPVFAVYSSFLQRGYDQVIHDLALQGHSMTICIDRAGIVGEDGETHQGLFDVPMLLPIPNISVFSPTTYDELRSALQRSISAEKGISVVRYPRGSAPAEKLSFKEADADVHWYGNNEDFCVVSYGREVVPCLKAIRLAKVPVAFLKLNKIFPLSEETLQRLLQFKKILFVEEGFVNGGVGAYLGNLLLNKGFSGTFKNVGIENLFMRAGKTEELLKEHHLDEESLARLISSMGDVKQ